MPNYNSRFEIKDKVIIDGDKSLVGHITGLMWTTDERFQLRVGYMHNGDAKTAWIEDWRLEIVK